MKYLKQATSGCNSSRYSIRGSFAHWQRVIIVKVKSFRFLPVYLYYGFVNELLNLYKNDGKFLAALPQDPTPKSKISTLSHTARSFTRLASSSVQLVPQGAGIPVMHLFTPKKSGLLRFARNDVKDLVPFCPLSLPSPSVLLRSHKTGTAIAFHPLLACAWGEGCNDGNNLSTYTLINLSTYKRKDCTTMIKNKNVKSLLTYLPIHLFTLKKKAAFTLAEVLITLGIIGVVAAMTIPNLMTNLRNRHIEAILKEDYSILQQMMVSANDNGAVNTPETYNNISVVKNWFDTYFLPYIKTARVCYDENGCWSSNVKYLNGADFNPRHNIGCGTASVSFVLNNGSFICMDDYSSSMMKSIYGISTTAHVSYVFFIDTNGDKKPNVIGEDIYVLGFKEETGNLVSAGSDMSIEDIRQNCSKQAGSYAGMFCLTLVKNQGWKINQK